MFVGSDALALAPLTRRIAYLKDGDWTVVDRARRATSSTCSGARGRARDQADAADRRRDRQGQFPPFHGEGAARAPGGDRRHAAPDGRARQPRAWRCRTWPFDFATVPRITMSACGSAFYAGLVGRWWFEAIARIPTDGDVASEFRYRTPPMPKGGLGAAGQPVGRDRRHAGRAALHARAGPAGPVDRERAGKQHGAGERRACCETVAGPEIGVASTKAFTAQLVGAGLPGARLPAARAARSTRRRKRR